MSRYKVVNILCPEFRHWPVDRRAIEQADERVRRKADEFQHGDGADMDNISITSLLVRETENIIAFVNTATPFRRPDGGCGRISDREITDDIVSLFRKNGRLVHNVVFDDGQQELEALCEAFAERKAAGAPLVYCQAYDVIENDWYKIGPYRPSICWVYLDRVDNWIRKMNPNGGELVADILDSEGSFDSFPHYSTFAEHGIGLIDLNRERVVALSNLAAWTVLQSADYISASLASAELPTTRE